MTTPTPRTEHVDTWAPDTDGTDDWKDAYFRMLNHALTLERELTAAHADLERARVNEARYLYWRSHAVGIFTFDGFNKERLKFNPCASMHPIYKNEALIDAAIDAARGKA